MINSKTNTTESYFRWVAINTHGVLRQIIHMIVAIYEDYAVVGEVWRSSIVLEKILRGLSCVENSPVCFPALYD